MSELTFLPVSKACWENIRSWDVAMPGKRYIGYNRLYFRNGWFSRWFAADGDTCPEGSVCLGATSEEVDFLNALHAWLSKKWKHGCTAAMCGDLDKLDCRIDDNMYLLEVEGGPCGCLMHFNTTFGNADYPVRIYLYREEAAGE